MSRPEKVLVGGTATVTVDAHGAVSGAFDPVDRCRPGGEKPP